MENLTDIQEAYRASILEGKLPLPEQFIKLVGREYEDQMNRMWSALWFNYVKNKGTISLTYYYEMFDDRSAFNTFLYHLSKSGWAIANVVPARHWAEATLSEDKLLKFVTPGELIAVRAHYKFHQYILTDATDTRDNRTKLGNEIKDTGIKRSGFAKLSSTKFQYDTAKLVEYREAIQLTLTKGMDKIAEEYPDMRRDSADYGAISKAILDYHIDNSNDAFTLNCNVNDSRGRAIKGALKKVFNPISSKDARSLLVIPMEHRKAMTAKGVNAVHLFIAELLGFKKGKKFQKSAKGIRAYANRTLHDIDLSDQEDRKDLHENIWLERLYDELDAYYLAQEEGNLYYWSVPIELDASASMLQYMGVLTGHRPFLEMTNVAGNALSDPWDFPGVPRQQFKKFMTPALYGSSQSCAMLWANAGIEYTSEQIKIVEDEIAFGKLAVADKFKEFIITNCKPTESMRVKIWDEEFDIKCNRYRSIGDRHVDYKIYDTFSETLQDIVHTHTHRVPDLEQFRRYFVTLLIHNLDSQVADRVASTIDWGIDIHDAFIVSPVDAPDVREEYADNLQDIYQNRNTIIKDYFDSIGVDSSSTSAWLDMKAHIDPIGEFEVNHMALK